MRIEQVRPGVLSITTPTGAGVVNPLGEDLAIIEELMIDIPSGRVAYTIQTYGGFLGLGEKLFAIPWEAMTLDTNRKVFDRNVYREPLIKAPGYDKNHCLKQVPIIG